MENFKALAAEKGWTETTQINYLLNFISENSLSGELNHEMTKQPVENGTEEFPFGWREAVSELELGCELFLAEIGVFNDSDPGTPFETYFVLYAGEKEEVEDFAERTVLERKPVHYGDFVKIINNIEKIDPIEYMID